MNFYLQFFCFYPKYLVFNVSRETYKIIPRCKFNGGYFYKYKGSFPGSPAFLGYFLEVFSNFLILTKHLSPSAFGNSKEILSSNFPPNNLIALLA